MSKKYPQIAFCSAITPATPEHYEHLVLAGITTASICLHISGHEHYKFAAIHTNLARQQGILTHAHLVTDLHTVVDDYVAFSKRFIQLGYSSATRITIWVNADKYVKERERKIIQMINLISNIHPRENIDVAFYKRDLDEGLYNIDDLPRMINLTVINCGALSAGVDNVGTWAYTADYEDNAQVLAYDYFGYYTDVTGYQLSLVDTDYVVQPGDTWHSISRRHGIPVDDLLMMNRVDATDKIFEGQVVRIA